MSIFNIFKLPTGSLDANDLLIVGDKSGDQGNVVQATISSVGAAMGMHPGYLAGRTYSTFPVTITQGTAPAAIDTIYLYPFWIYSTVTLTGGFIRVVTGGAASSVKSAIYANSPVSNRPLGAPLMVDNTGQATTGNNTSVTLPFTGTLTPGLYWFGSKYTGTLPTVYSISTQTGWFLYYAGAAGTQATTDGLAFADTYSNNMPTFAEAASFSLSGNIIPLLYLLT